MTSDRSRKKAARARMAATGEPYSTARRAVRTEPEQPVQLADPPAIDPREHAVQSYHWGLRAYHLVSYEGRYFAWLDFPDGPPVVYPMPDEEAGRHFLDSAQAANVLHVPWDEEIISIFLLDPAVGTRIAYHAAMVDVADSGIWLAVRDATADGEQIVVLGRFGDLGEALEEFAGCAEQAADQVERGRTVGLPDVIAGVLRHRAAMARADVARARLGDAIRRNQAAIGRGEGLSPVWHAAGLPRESVGRVLAGEEWTWPKGPVARPPGARRPDTPVTTLATHSAGGHTFTLFSYQDSAGGKCVGIDRDGRSTSVTDVAVDEEHLVNAGMTMATRGHGIAAVYGRAHDSVTELYALMKDGSQIDWPVHDDPRNQERYFTVIADCDALDDIVAAAPPGRTSLKGLFGIWFSQPPARGSSKRGRGRGPGR